MLRDLVQEVRELGTSGTAFRLGWEIKVRSGLAEHLVSPPPCLMDRGGSASDQVHKWPEALWFPHPRAVADAIKDRVSVDQRNALLDVARNAAAGRIVCFGRWVGDFGDPIEWHRNPLNGEKWDPDVHWTGSTRDESRVGDVKLTWEVARFPHSYVMARAAAQHPRHADGLADSLARQIDGFIAQNPWGRGIHWSSGQETIFRLLAWIFAYDVLLSRSACAPRMTVAIGNAIVAGAAHVEQHLEYAERAVHNNHLLSEALGLYIAGSLFPSTDTGRRWLHQGKLILDEQADRQFYADGGYIQQSHNYHRVAIQDLLWACLVSRALGHHLSSPWLKALERSVDFLVAHQNPGDGRVPNYGSNDGALPTPLTSCDFSDFRPTLQTANILVRGERLYEPGPWDEEAAWVLGPLSLETPLRNPSRRSVSFKETGHHVLRGHNGGTFAAFRCGSLRDRFSQIDMLQLDVWWRGFNVLVDGGSYLYNGPAEWHEHFFRTGSHNTVTVDGRDQMLHLRRFKVAYWTRGKLLSFRDEDGFAVAAGEHYGYRRHPGRCVHRRSVLFAKDDLWVVADTIAGDGPHAARLHWLGGDFPFEATPVCGSMRLATPQGDFGVTVFDPAGNRLPATIVAGQEQPPRGWLARYYGQKTPAPSLAVETAGTCPITLLSVLGPADPVMCRTGDTWELRGTGTRLTFRLREGLLAPLGT